MGLVCGGGVGASGRGAGEEAPPSWRLARLSAAMEVGLLSPLLGVAADIELPPRSLMATSIIALKVARGAARRLRANRPAMGALPSAAATPLVADAATTGWPT